MSDTKTMGWFLIVALLVIGGTGCERTKPTTPPSLASGLASPSAASQVAAVPWPQVTDYVLHPDIVPEEQDAEDLAFRRQNKLPVRVFTLAPNLTETVFALGLGELLIGRDTYSVYPPQVEALPSGGGLLDRSIERIVQQTPDLVLTVHSDVRLSEKLSAHGISVVCLPNDSLAEVYGAIRETGKILGRPKTAERLVQHLQDDMQRIVAPVRRSIPAGLRVALISDSFSAPPSQNYFAGPASYLGEFLTLLGTTPAVGKAEGAWVPMSLEHILAADPQVIVEIHVGQEITPALRERALAAWESAGPIAAVRDQRILLLNHPALLVPGPRINIALLELAKGLMQETEK